ncbi:MAG: YncE family protein [Thermoanaerobaculia bacterium]
MAIGVFAPFAVAASPSPAGTIVIAGPGFGPLCNECYDYFELDWIEPSGISPHLYLFDFTGDGQELGTPSMANQSQILAPVWRINQQKLVTLNSSGQKVREVLLPFHVSAVAAAQNGTVIAGYQYDQSHGLHVFDEQGNVIRTFTSTGITPPFDVGPDSCTVFSTTGDRTNIARFDVCSGQPLSSWHVPAPGAAQIRALADGGVVVVTSASPQELWFFDGTGAIVRRLTVQLENADIADRMAFDSDPHYVWLGFRSTSPPFMLAKINLESGRVVASYPPMFTGLFAFAVLGEQRPTLAAITASSIPTMSSWFLAALACACAAIALRRVGG